MREHIINLIRESKTWNDASNGVANKKNPMPVLESMSNSVLLEAYEFYVLGLS